MSGITARELVAVRAIDLTYGGPHRGWPFDGRTTNLISAAGNDARPYVRELHRIGERLRLARQYGDGTSAGRDIKREALGELRAWQKAVPPTPVLAIELKVTTEAMKGYTAGLRLASAGSGPRMRLANVRKLDSLGNVRGLDTKNRRVQVVASTNQIARDGAVIEQLGWSFENFDRTPVVLWNHDDRSLPIGKVLPEYRDLTSERLIETIQFASGSSSHPAAEAAWQSVRDGFTGAVSVRWLPGETQMQRRGGKDVLVFTKGHELLEISFVNIPADPGAVVLRNVDAGNVFNPRTARLVPA